MSLAWMGLSNRPHFPSFSLKIRKTCQDEFDEFLTSFDKFQHLIRNLEFTHREAARAPSMLDLGP